MYPHFDYGLLTKFVSFTIETKNKILSSFQGRRGTLYPTVVDKHIIPNSYDEIILLGKKDDEISDNVQEFFLV